MYFKIAFMYIMTALQFHFGFICKAVKIVYGHITSTSTLYNAPSIVTTMHRHEQTIYLQLINKKDTWCDIENVSSILHLTCLYLVGSLSC